MPLGNLGERSMQRKRKDEGTINIITVAKVDTILLIALPKNRSTKESHTMPCRPQ
jgi:predicted ATP-dependent protease